MVLEVWIDKKPCAFVENVVGCPRWICSLPPNWEEMAATNNLRDRNDRGMTAEVVGRV